MDYWVNWEIVAKTRESMARGEVDAAMTLEQREARADQGYRDLFGMDYIPRSGG